MLLSHWNAAVKASVQRVCRVPLLRSFASENPLVSTLVVPDYLSGLRADRVLLAALQVRAHFQANMNPISSSRSNANGLSFSGRLVRAAFESEMVRTLVPDDGFLQTRKLQVA
jgi:hypothetical protein